MHTHIYLPFLSILLFIPGQHLDAAMRTSPNKAVHPSHLSPQEDYSNPTRQIVAAGKPGPLTTWLTEPDHAIFCRRWFWRPETIDRGATDRGKLGQQVIKQFMDGLKNMIGECGGSYITCCQWQLQRPKSRSRRKLVCPH